MLLEVLQNSLNFFIHAFIIVASIIVVILTIAALAIKNKPPKKHWEINEFNTDYLETTEALQEIILDEKSLKKQKKLRKKIDEDSLRQKAKVYVLDFNGDIKASATEHLREEITAVLSVAKPQDEVVIKVESPGGLVHGYGLAAAQLKRIRDANIPLTICVDKVAASGGYLMACVGHKIVASPFALIGSIGVVAQVPNFNKLLKKHDVEYKEYTAGDYKRTVSLFGEITEKGEEKFKQQLELTHQLFKSFVARYRPGLNMSEIATGEFWYGETALGLKLVDELCTSDEYLTRKMNDYQILTLSLQKKQKISEKLTEILGSVTTRLVDRFVEQNNSVKNV